MSSHSAADDGKHAFSVIGVDSSLLEAKGREVWREGGSGSRGTPADLQAGGVWVAPVHLFGHPSDLSLSQDVFLMVFGLLLTACGLRSELICELFE